MKRAILLLCVPAFCLLSCSGDRDFEDPGPLRSPDGIRTYLRTLVSEPGGPPAISVAVGVGDSIVFAEAFGLADIGNGIPATPDTPFRVYSVSKGITAAAVLQLVEKGTVSLDDPIREYVPAFPKKRWPITVRHLLAHTSGIRHYRKNAGEISSTTEYPDLNASLSVFKDDSLEFEPGTGYLYTSFGFNLLTGVVEAASGMSFEQYLGANIFGPAGMTHSSLDVQGRGQRGAAHGYWPPAWYRRSNRLIDPLPNVSGRYGSSGVLSTPSDLVRLLIALNRGRLLSPGTYKLMCTVPYPDLAPTQGLGWNVSNDGDSTVYRTGAGTGFVAIVAYEPRWDITAAIAANQNEWEGRYTVLSRIIEVFAQGR